LTLLPLSLLLSLLLLLLLPSLLLVAEVSAWPAKKQTSGECHGPTGLQKHGTLGFSTQQRGQGAPPEVPPPPPAAAAVVALGSVVGLLIGPAWPQLP
jgi:hypothetical protein